MTESAGPLPVASTKTMHGTSPRAGRLFRLPRRPYVLGARPGGRWALGQQGSIMARPTAWAAPRIATPIVHLHQDGTPGIRCRRPLSRPRQLMALAKRRSMVSGTRSWRTRDEMRHAARRASERERHRPRIPSSHTCLPRLLRSDGKHGDDTAPAPSMILLKMPSKWCRLSWASAFVYLPPARRVDAETQELVDGDPRPGAAGSPLCDPVIARERLHREASEEEPAPPSQASAWSWPATGIEEQGDLDGDGRRTPDAVGDPHPAGAAPTPQGILRDARNRAHALRGGSD